MNVPGVCDPVPLQGAKVVAIAELGKQLLEDGPVLITAIGAEFLLQMSLQISLDAIIVQQRVVNVD